MVPKVQFIITFCNKIIRAEVKTKKLLWISYLFARFTKILHQVSRSLSEHLMKKNYS